MISLETEFVSGAGGYSANPLTYKQVTRTETVALYARHREDGTLKDHEVFRIKLLKKGHQIFKQTLEDDTEQYPSNEKFGRTAWSFLRLGAAMVKYQELVEGKVATVDTSDDGDETEVAPRLVGRARNERPELVYPATERFTMKDLALVNSVGWNPALIYNHIKKEMEGGVLVEVARVKTDSGRGKPSVVYSLVNR